MSRGKEIDQDGRGFHKSNQSHYKEADPESGGTLVGIRGSGMVLLQSDAQSPE